MYTENFDNMNNLRLYDSAGHDGNGVRSPAQVTITSGILNIAGTSNGTTGGLNLKTPHQQYGKWSIRAKAPIGTGKYHPVILLWGEGSGGGVNAPTGEIDILEVWRRPNRDYNETTLHYGDGSQMIGGGTAVDMTQWHTYNLQWTPTKISVWIDDLPPYWQTTDTSKFPQVAMDLCIQLDWFPQEQVFPNGTASMQVDWVKVWTLNELEATPVALTLTADDLNAIWNYDVDAGTGTYSAKGAVFTGNSRAGSIANTQLPALQADVDAITTTLTTIQLDLDYIKNALDQLTAEPGVDPNALLPVLQYAFNNYHNCP